MDMCRQKRDAGCTGRAMQKMEQPSRRKRGRPKRRFMDMVRDDMQLHQRRETGNRRGRRTSAVIRAIAIH